MRFAVISAVVFAFVVFGRPTWGAEIAFQGSTPPDAGPLSDLEFSGVVFIDLTAPVQFVGDRRHFFLIPQGSFTFEVASLDEVLEEIAAVRFLTAGPGEPTELTIEAPPQPSPDFTSVSLRLAPAVGTDPFAGASLSDALSAVADGCCSGLVVLELPSGLPIAASIDSLTAVPEPPMLMTLPMGAVVLLGAGAVAGRPTRRSKRDRAVAKFWLALVALEPSSAFSSQELRRIERLVSERHLHRRRDVRCPR
jgi:hypothetical protein